MTLARLTSLLALLALSWLMIAAPAVLADEPDTAPAVADSTAKPADLAMAKPLAHWQATLDRIEKTLDRETVSDNELDAIRDELERARTETSAFVERHTPRFEEAAAQLKKLGPAPDGKPSKDGEPVAPDSAAVAEQRAKLTRLVSEIGGAVKTAGVLEVRAGHLYARAQTILLQRFSEQLLQRSRSPLKLGVWKDVVREAQASVLSLDLLISDWLGGMPSRWPLVLTLLAATGAFLMLRFVSRGWVTRLRYPAEPGEIEFFERAGTAIWVTGLRALPFLGLAGVLYAGLHLSDMLPPRIDTLALTGCLMLAGFGAITALSTTILAPSRPQWRIFPASDTRAQRLDRLITIIAAVYAIDLFLARLNEVLFSPLALTIAQSFLASVIFAFLLIAMLRVPRAPAHERHGPLRLGWLFWLRPPLWILVLAILVAAAAGYIALARFMASQVVVTGSILIVLYLLHVTIDELSQSMVNRKAPVGHWLMVRMGVSAAKAEQISVLVLLLLNLLLATVGIPLLMLQWGFGWDDVRNWLNAAYFGFQLGNLRISLATILFAVLLFVLSLIVFRLISRWLDERVLARARLDRGLRGSIRTGLSYVGIILAFVIAVSYAGADFSDLALVAGALSVGIGFGLQNVVNNFVSGIILLAERPIKIGDWIVVGGEEGIVRRINVRATEIETFERSHVILPNSSLIGGQVKNWMLRSPIGRIEVPVGVSYASDPEQVREILMGIAQSHEAVLEDPGPTVVFVDFGASSLDFTLRAFIRDINSSLSVRSDLRFAIFAAFKQAAIEIPFPQQDLHLRDIERLESALGSRPRRRPATRRTQE